MVDKYNSDRKLNLYKNEKVYKSSTDILSSRLQLDDSEIEPVENIIDKKSDNKNKKPYCTSKFFKKKISDSSNSCSSENIQNQLQNSEPDLNNELKLDNMEDKIKFNYSKKAMKKFKTKIYSKSKKRRLKNGFLKSSLNLIQKPINIEHNNNSSDCKSRSCKEIYTTNKAFNKDTKQLKSNINNNSINNSACSTINANINSFNTNIIILNNNRQSLSINDLPLLNSNNNINIIMNGNSDNESYYNNSLSIENALDLLEDDNPIKLIDFQPLRTVSNPKLCKKFYLKLEEKENREDLFNKEKLLNSKRCESDYYRDLTSAKNNNSSFCSSNYSSRKLIDKRLNNNDSIKDSNTIKRSNSIIQVENQENNPHESKETKIITEVDDTKIFPVKDYEQLSLTDQLIYDKRGFGRYFLEKLLPDHIIINIFFLNSLLTPRSLRIVRCICALSFALGFNAMLFIDDDIKKRANIELDPNVIYTHILNT